MFNIFIEIDIGNLEFDKGSVEIFCKDVEV